MSENELSEQIAAFNERSKTIQNEVTKLISDQITNLSEIVEILRKHREDLRNLKLPE